LVKEAEATAVARSEDVEETTVTSDEARAAEPGAGRAVAATRVAKPAAPGVARATETVAEITVTGQWKTVLMRRLFQKPQSPRLQEGPNSQHVLSIERRVERGGTGEETDLKLLPSEKRGGDAAQQAKWEPAATTMTAPHVGLGVQRRSHSHDDITRVVVANNIAAVRLPQELRQRPTPQRCP